jgi:SAM-dependent methyltransferase
MRQRSEGTGERTTVKDKTVYDQAFFDKSLQDTRSSAAAVVPLLVGILRPSSVLDVGCGIGTWSAEFLRAGVPDVIGVDGSYIDRAALAMPPERFVAADLIRPLDLGRRFDLVVSLEVAEHLPESAARTFVGSLTRHGPMVIFSAAIPGQGGTHHINEQWPEYWVELFEAQGFRCLDPIRRELWSDSRVQVCYRQNMLVFAHRDHVLPGSWTGQAVAPTPDIGLVHPEVYQFFRDREDDWRRLSFWQALWIALHLPRLFARGVSLRVRRWLGGWGPIR